MKTKSSVEKQNITIKIITFAFYQMELKEKQKKILDVAVELFKEKGYMGSSVRDLATKLNIKAASLYAHIRSKEEILEWICFGIAQEFFDELQEVKNTSIPPKEKLNLFIDKHLSVVLKNRDVTHIYSNEWKHLEERLPEFIALRKNYQQEVEELISEIYRAENWELRSSSFTTRFILHTLNNSYFWFKRNTESTSEITDEIRDKILYGLLGKVSSKS
ncbi:MULTISPECIES: TetR/AcrR family transcriptional regulator [Chryseobacterium]|uniref:TetR/AcrR family transcriptional regulator n=1 Tax=Chryseobacterium nepalense TaxID=1854498 RepID=A0ABY4K360_9FLAO|nr:MULTISPECIES: TetR/AcrR family transcriptional regulator [Chryseobacterium]MEA1849725.1 TetR/AcrR family transcriptional regulator [Chryseobacterium sp. MHB01]MEC5172310.1 AcrR family transcriptional regulator [Chryseobacterium nepalense]UPQ75117.1 TetR/AcrR family transcriptional regulator [Chryseobacterium nepalense]